MDKKTLMIVCLAAVVVAAAAAAVVLMSGGSQDSHSGDKVYAADVRVQEGAGYAEYSGEGKTYQEILKDALGSDIVISNNGNVQSYKGKTNAGDHSWAVFRWKAPEKWENASNKDLADGMTLALEYSVRTTVSGVTEYSKPDLTIEQEVYFYIQIPELDEIRNSTLKSVQEKLKELDFWLQKSGFSDDDMKKGFWTKGKGANSNEALANAVHDYMFKGSDLKLLTDPAWDYRAYTLDGAEGYYQYGIRPDTFGWFNTFLGWEDLDIGTQRWTYWSQGCYNPNAKSLDIPEEWQYNQKTLGQYDMETYRYYAIILQSTSQDEADNENVMSKVPTPSTIPAGMRS